jgi:hypothetical protein
MLAGLMKVLPFRYEISPNASQLEQISAYQPELLIGLFNQIWLLLAVGLVFCLAKRLFDPLVAWFSAGVFACTDLFWRFSVSGLSTVFLVVVFLVLVWCLLRLEQGTREEQRSHQWFVRWAIMAGVLVGMGALTRYSFGWLILPVVAFFVLFFGQRAGSLALTACLAFGLVFAPWLARNYYLSGTLFGTAGYAIYADSPDFPGSSLERSLKLDKPDMPQPGAFALEDYLRKLVVNSSQIMQNDLPRLGGNWLSAFFLAGLLLPFRNPFISRLRIFLVLCLILLTPVQALGKTHLGANSPEITSENLLVVLAPLVFIYGAGMCHLLLDQITWPTPELGRWAPVGIGLVACAPLILTLLPPRSVPISYPPYHPWLIQRTTELMKDNEMMMSDVPWAVAWYGRRQCLWLTLNLDSPDHYDDFFAIHDFQRTIHALFLSPLILDARFQSLTRGEYGPWGRFIFNTIMKDEVPKGFPLRCVWARVSRVDHLFLTDSERWKAPAK